MEDEERRDLLKMNEDQLQEVARVCNRYPSIELNYEVANKGEIVAGDDVALQVQLEREFEEDEVGPADALRYNTLALFHSSPLPIAEVGVACAGSRNGRMRRGGLLLATPRRISW